ncbi:MAG: HesB/IscA family protein [Bacteroidota bacterium]
MSITISDKAAERIQKIRSEKNVSDQAYLRIGVVSGGCSGLTYDLDFDEEFNGPAEDSQEQVFEDHGIKCVVDMRSFLYLAGTKLDYSEGLDGQGFHFHNPNASRTCSCGESFMV